MGPPHDNEPTIAHKAQTTTMSSLEMVAAASKTVAPAMHIKKTDKCRGSMLTTPATIFDRLHAKLPPNIPIVKAKFGGTTSGGSATDRQNPTKPPNTIQPQASTWKASGACACDQEFLVLVPALAELDMVTL